jgi:hypothetical protein
MGRFAVIPMADVIGMGGVVEKKALSTVFVTLIK